MAFPRRQQLVRFLGGFRFDEPFLDAGDVHRRTKCLELGFGLSAAIPMTIMLMHADNSDHLHGGVMGAPARAFMILAQTQTPARRQRMTRL
jgi:hypothetical protein